MGAGCCGGEGEDPLHHQNTLEKLASRQRSVLLWALWINLTMFFVEYGASLTASSTALQGDALDMLGDALVYGMSIWGIGRTEASKLKLAGVKGWIMVLLSLTVFWGAVYRYIHSVVPEGNTISFVGVLALVANAICTGILFRMRSDDLNMKSVWICSRNDTISNVAVILAGVLVYATGSLWPDLIVGLGIGTLALTSGWGVLREVRRAQSPP